ncbi:uncharacterized protein BX663DRAFT_488130 [Cokeromyces recurvatus]|uniref:uncharacterized protein n=1 Tax=Cokeromyces recurvatus TaxID=90255 RepID=UPI002220BDD9|nr:uncharacterized protein BX663DRAFT_488130 [Cokeromyces recurvatus]KAI7900818.1 hypothetical protein BX663DRAFT_488130 [Cokeromyces recurvatus]
MSKIDDDLKEKIDRLPRWQFRKRQKIEKRRKKRKELAEKDTSITPSKEKKPIELIVERQKYEREKQEWEKREEQFRMIELAKKHAKEKEEKAKELSRKRWQETLMNLPMLPPQFSVNNNTTTTNDESISVPFRKFIQSTENPIEPLRPRKTYRDRFLERKRAASKKK